MSDATKHVVTMWPQCRSIRGGYNLAALLFFFLLLDNLLRRVEGQGWKGFGRVRGDSRWWSCLGC
jgi:hypothetical protein